MAINMLKPDIVDVSSGVEIDGFKNYDLMKEIIYKVRSVI
ncbi:hypothetical protein [Thermoanaerobacterium thermosaccharolyticum]|nr:hypothetical protein [Thermoanaerobacterium thermosaccharolyticum]